MMNKSNPSVAIGMPIYNEEKHLEESLESLLNQSFKNITIYIIDNCSTDNTQKICKSFSSREKRIKYFRNEKNIGSALNFLKSVQHPEIKNHDYFTFARGNALFSPHCIEKCVRALEKYGETILAYSTPVWIDEHSNVLEDKPIMYYNTLKCDTVTRVVMSLWTKPFPLYGVVRFQKVKDFYKNYKPYIGDDHAFLLYLAIHGSFYHVADERWYRRFTYQNESFNERIRRYRQTLFDSKWTLNYLFPFVMLPIHLLRQPLISNISIKEKVKLFIIILFTAPLRFFVSIGKPVDEY